MEEGKNILNEIEFCLPSKEVTGRAMIDVYNSKKDLEKVIEEALTVVSNYARQQTKKPQKYFFRLCLITLSNSVLENVEVRSYTELWVYLFGFLLFFFLKA